MRWRWAVVLLGWAVGPGPARSQEVPAPRPSPTEVRARIAGLLARVGPSVVQIRQGEDAARFSGTIVTEDGYVATCAHHLLMPGAAVTVTLADGREVPAEVLGSHRSWDISLIKIKGRDGEKWPRVAFGRSTALRRDDLCVALGYPALKNRPGVRPEPKVRLGRVAYSAAPGTLQTSCLIAAGDSGGPLLDLDGRLVGIHRGAGSINFAGTMHSGAELFEDLWDDLAAGKRIELAPRGLGPFGDELRRLADRSPGLAVDVLCDGEPTLLGTVVDPDGWILTKASDLEGRITCRLPDGRVLDAERRGTSRPHDLAMLKVDARGLPAIRWGPGEPPGVGSLLVAPGCRTRWSLVLTDGGVTPASALAPTGAASSPSGIVSHPRRQVLPMNGFPFFDVEPGDDGLTVTKVPTSGVETVSPVRVGDLVDRIAGKPVPDLRALEAVLAENNVAGDRLAIRVRRGDRAAELSVVNRPSHDASVGSPHLLSHRRTGFPDVFSTDLDLSPKMCGGPLVDLEGQTVGVNIARASEIECYAIPAGVVRKLIPQLKFADGDARGPASRPVCP